MNREAYEKLDYSLGLISTAVNDKRYGCIVNSFHQVTSTARPNFTVALSRNNETTAAVLSSGSFCVTLLGENADNEIINTFGYQSARVADKFDGREVFADENGNPYLKEGMVSRISCKVVNQVEIGNYVLVVGEAVAAEPLSKDGVLTLKAFSDRGRLAPANAAVIREMEGNGFLCTICGYVYEGETLPEGYICPICRAPVAKFEKRD